MKTPHIIAFIMDEKVCQYLAMDANLGRQTLVPDPHKAKITVSEEVGKQIARRYNQSNQWNQGIYRAIPWPVREKYPTNRSTEYPNIARMTLDRKTTVEIHEYPDAIDGEQIDKTIEPEVDDIGDGEYIVRFFGYKILIKRTK